MTFAYPSVSLIPTPSDLPRDHHGPFHKTSKPQADRPPEGCDDNPNHKPKYFKNPWPSYRQASLHDAYLAYKLGAAIALPPHQTPGAAKLRLVDQELYDEDPREEHGALLARTDSTVPKKMYIRPDFAEVRETDDLSDWREPPVDVVEPNWGDGGDGKERVTWLGHAGVLVQIPWKHGRQGTCGIIFDPIFSYRCSPTQYVGPARYLDPPVRWQCYQRFTHAVSHMTILIKTTDDHLDYYTIIDLWKYHQATIHFFVPMGLKQWFTSSGIPAARVTELDWWHESLVSFPLTQRYTDEEEDEEATAGDTGPAAYPPAQGSRMSTEADYVEPSALTLKLVFTPAQHRSGRGVFDHMTTLWGSWCLGVVEDEDRRKVGQRGMQDWAGFKVYFGGDTGYRYATAEDDDDTAICPAFQQIADHYAPFNLALLPLSTGSSLPFLRTVLSLSVDQYTMTSSLHCSPADSLEIHKIIRAERTVGIHWGTFCDADEARGTRVDFGRCRREMGVGKEWQEGEQVGHGRFVMGDIGETFILPARG